MSKTQEVYAAMVQAMKAKDAERKMALSLLLSALKGKAKDKRAELTEEEENAIIMREIKQTKETLDSCPPDRSDLIKQARQRLEIYSAFAPKQLSEEEVREVIEETLSELEIQAPTPKDRGRIMKALMPKVRGKADGAMVKGMVDRLLG